MAPVSVIIAMCTFGTFLFVPIAVRCVQKGVSQMYHHLVSYSEAHMNKKLKGSFMLLITAIVWGFAFTAQSVGLDSVGSFTFNSIRYFIGGLVLLPVIFIMGKIQGRKESTFNKQALKGGICCGICLFVASSFQQYSLNYTTVGHCSFITAMYVIFVPVVETIMGRKNDKKIWVCVFLALIGMYLLTMTGENFTLSKGDLLVLIGSLCFTAHIMIIDKFSPTADGVTISCIQFFTASILSVPVMLFAEAPQAGAIVSAWLPILYAGVMSCGVAYTLQVVYQKDVPPTPASIILCLESVFGVIGGWLLLGQNLSVREIVGCVLMFIAIVLAQI